MQFFKLTFLSFFMSNLREFEHHILIKISYNINTSLNNFISIDNVV